MTESKKIHYVELEGLFFDKGLDFYSGTDTEFTNRFYDNVPPDSVDDFGSSDSPATGLGNLPSFPIKVEPFKATESFSSVTLDIVATPERISTLLRKQQFADTSVATAYTGGGGTIELEDSVVSTGDIFWVGDSTFEVTDDASAPDYEVTELTSNSADFAVGDPVYTQAPPYFNGRRVEIGLFNSQDETTQAKWIGRIEGSIQFDGSNIRIPCRSVFAGLDNVTIGNSIRRYGLTEFPSFLIPEITEDGSSHDRIRKRTQQSNENITAGYVRVEDSLYPYLNKDNDPEFNNSLIRTPVGGSPPVELEVFRQNIDDLIATPVFVVSKKWDEDPRTFGTQGPFVASSTQDLANITEPNSEIYPYHPLAVFAAFVKSTKTEGTADPDEFDIFGNNFALDLNWALSDNFVSDIKALISETPTYQIKHWVLHFDREPIEIFKELRQLLRAYGFFIGTDKEGFLTVRQSELPSINVLNSAFENNVLDRTILQSDVVQSSGSENVTDKITAIVGNLPWEDGRTFLIESGNPVPERASSFIRQKEFSLEIPYEDPDSFPDLISSLVSRANLQSYALPRVELEVSDQFDKINGDLDYGIGNYVALKDLPFKRALLVDENGNFISDVSGSNITGQVVHNEYIPQSNTYKLVLNVSFSSPIRLRAPAGLVNAVDNTNSVFTIELGDDFGTDNNSDAQQFNELDQIQVYNTDGTQKDATLFTITKPPETDGANVLTVNTDPVGKMLANDVIRLANIDSDGSNDGYDNDTVLSNYNRVYVFMSDGSRTLGDDELDGDIYG